MLVNSDLSPMNGDSSQMNSDLLSLSSCLFGRALCLAWHICLSINLYPCSYHNLADWSFPHTAHAHGLLHNYYIERSMK